MMELLKTCPFADDIFGVWIPWTTPLKAKLTFPQNKFSLSRGLGSHNNSIRLSATKSLFLQIILGIETRNTKQYHVLKLSSKLFANMRLNFEGDHMPLLAAMLPPAQAAIADEETRPEPDQSQEHLPTPPRPTTSDQIPPVFEQGHTSDPNIASFLGAHASDPDLFTSINVEDETLGESFHNTPPRSTQVPPVGPTSGVRRTLATPNCFVFSKLSREPDVQKVRPP
ncbi:hypothetical protein Tco_1400936 [Tanacetum coccineum]